MKKTKKIIVALVLAFIMAAMPAMPFMQPIVALAAVETLEDQGFVPIRATFEEANEASDDEIVVSWNRAERSIHIAINSDIIIFTPGSNVAHINGLAVVMLHEVILTGGVSYIYLNDLLHVMEAFIILTVYEEDVIDETGAVDEDAVGEAEAAAEDTEPEADEPETFVLYLTEEARDLVLYDFDFVVDAILENSAWETVLNRRLGFDFVLYAATLRHLIYEMYPIVFPLSLEEFEAFLGTPLYEVLFPIRDSEDPLYVAANYLSYFLFYMMMLPFEGIGHLGPRDIDTYRMLYSLTRMFYHQGAFLRETDPNNAMRLDIFTHPDVVWFYGEVEVDLDGDITDAMPDVPGNIVTEIIVPGEVAYLSIGTFAANWEYDNEITIPFFEEIQDFEHLILDLRGNGGGLMAYFPANILSRLIDEPVEITMHQFFSGGDIATSAMDALVQTLTYAFDGIEDNDVYEWFTVEVLPARDFIAQEGMTSFNQDDLASLEYVMVVTEWIMPHEDGIFFNGKVWLLVDGGSASASSHATLILINTGLATVVGENTSGVMGSHHVYIILPNTGLLFRIDVGYMTDANGVSLEEHGIAPHVRNFDDMDALETVLELILEWEG